jgi:hypothetical protein
MQVPNAALLELPLVHQQSALVLIPDPLDSQSLSSDPGTLRGLTMAGGQPVASLLSD